MNGSPVLVSSKFAGSTPLRWVGGKRDLLRRVPVLRGLPSFDLVADPFVGGGSSLFLFEAKSYQISDTNSELINFFRVARSQPLDLAVHVTLLRDSLASYNLVRAASPVSEFERAVRFLYLNRTSFLGMWRVNRLGRYNVPYGGGGRLVAANLSRDLSQLNRKLQQAEVVEEDFELALNTISGDGSLVFIDPPYSVKGEETFGRYGVLPFGKCDHERLARKLEELVRTGSSVVLCLPLDRDIIALYDGFVELNREVSGRFPRGEVVLVNGALDEVLRPMTGRISRY